MGLPPVEGCPGSAIAVLVVDVGATSTRVGLSGVTAPTADLEHPKAENVSLPYKFCDKKGLELNVDALEACVRAGLSKVPGCSKSSEDEEMLAPLDMPALLVEPTQASLAIRSGLAEVLFERLGVSRAFLAKRAALNTYCYGQTTAAVLDVGASHSCSAAVLHGWVLPERVRECQVGGDLIDQTLFEQLQGTVEVVAPGGPDAGSRELNLVMTRQLKEQVCRIDGGQDGEHSAISSASPALLPDGTQIALGTSAKRLQQLTENVLFEPDVLDFDLWPTGLHVRKPLCRGDSAAPLAYTGIHAMLADSAAVGDEANEVPIPRQFGRSVVVTGGCAQLPGLRGYVMGKLSKTRGRLQKAKLDCRLEVSKKGAFGRKRGAGESVEAIDPDSAEIAAARELRHSAWTGGSILASLGSFEDFLVSSAEYQEAGTRVLSKKCP